jgi:hypothetical protein
MDFFEPLRPYIVFVIVLVVSLVVKFLAEQLGIKVDATTWRDGLANAVAVALTLFLNVQVLKLPVPLQGYVPLVVQGLILLLVQLGLVVGKNQLKDGAKKLQARFR